MISFKQLAIALKYEHKYQADYSSISREQMIDYLRSYARHCLGLECAPVNPARGDADTSAAIAAEAIADTRDNWIEPVTCKR